MNHGRNLSQIGRQKLNWCSQEYPASQNGRIRNKPKTTHPQVTQITPIQSI